MIITTKVEVSINPRNMKHYKNLGFNDIKIKDKITIEPKKLPQHSKIKVQCKCSNCNTVKSIRIGDYNKITNQGTNDYYCYNCKNIKTKKTLQEKFGVDNTFQLEETKNKIKSTNMERYGVEHHLQSKQSLDKLKTTNMERYGVEFVQQNKDIRVKTEKTSLEKYGYKTSLSNKQVKDKIKSTNIERYGVDNPIKNKAVQDKSRKTRIENIKNKYNKLNIIDIVGDIYTIGCDNNLEHKFEITSTLLYHRYIRYNTVVCTVCNGINSKCSSGQQILLTNYITSIYNGVININDRSVINGELDIYLPELNIAFEFNGLYWHNELFKDKNYHSDKSDQCNEKGIQLIHIYEDDWLYKQNIIKSIISNKIGKTINRIYARKCQIKVILDNKLINTFLNKNHIQGHVNSSIKLGLYYNGELVSLMTFGKLRKIFNQKSTNLDFEMLRFCNKKHTSVIGGASKLFNFFIINYNYDSIISYADRSYSNGNLYENLNFKLVHITKPNYFYVISGVKMNRFNFRKDILVKQGYSKNKTEHQIMIDRGYYRIYNSGNYKYIYNK